MNTLSPKTCVTRRASTSETPGSLSLSGNRPYKAGDVLRACKAALSNDPLMPKPLHQTVIKPHPAAALHYWGAPAAFLLPATTKILIAAKVENTAVPAYVENPKEIVPTESVGFVWDHATGKTEFITAAGRRSPEPGQAGPLFHSSLTERLRANGMHDPRFTAVEHEGKLFMVATAVGFCKKDQVESIIASRTNTSIRLKGGTTELFVAYDPAKPWEMRSFGQIGPDFYFKNVVPGSQVIDVDGEPGLLFYTRVMPGIQAFPLAFSTMERLGRDGGYRRDFWRERLDDRAVLADHTVIEPVLLHEGAGNPHIAPYRRNGQLAAGGAPIPLTVTCGDGSVLKRQLMIYNSVPDLGLRAGSTPENPQYDDWGRVVNACLLDETGRKVAARAPYPIIVPRTSEEIFEQEGVKPFVPAGLYIAFSSGQVIDSAGRLGIFYTEGDSLIRVAWYSSAQELADYVNHFDANGNLKRGIPRAESVLDNGLCVPPVPGRVSANVSQA